MDKTKAKKVKYPCSMCGLGVRSNAKECMACYKWVHHRCHVAHNGIGWNEDPEKTSYRCPKCLYNIVGVIQKMVTKKGKRLRRKRVKRGAVLATKATKRKEMDRESNLDTSNLDTNEKKKQKQKHTGKTYTEEEVNELKKQWVEENRANIMAEDKNNESNILDNSIFRIYKTCIDCDGDYEATYDEIGRLNCYVCGLTSHGCKPNDKVQAEKLYNMSKGYKWICYDCTKETDRRREGNKGWEGEEDTEVITTKKSGENIKCSKCKGSADPIVEPIIIDVTPNASISTPLSPMDTTTGVNGEDKDGGNKVETEVGWEESVGKLDDEEKESIKFGKYLTDAIIRVIMIYIQKWLHTKGGIGGKVTCLAPSVIQMIRKQVVSEEACKDVVDVINGRDLVNKEYIMMPVNNNENPAKDAGEHWSLLIYRKSDSKFYHYDSIRGVNERHAKKVVEVIAKANPYFKNEIVAMNCPQQNDNHSCGIHTIMYACKIAGNIANLDNKSSTNIYNELEMETEKKGDITKTRDWVKDLIAIGKNDSKKKTLPITQEMIFYKKQTKECWFYTNRSCKFEKNCFNEHKMRCMDLVITGKCQNKDCKRGHPMICRDIEKGRICSNRNNCHYLHPDNYFRQGVRYQNNRNRNRNMNNNGMNYVNGLNNNNSNNNSMSGYYNGYGGYGEWNGGNRTDWDNKNYNGYMEHDNRKSWEHGYGRDENFIKERNYCEQWPTPLEGRLLEMIERRMDQRWNENRRQGRW